MPANVGVAWIRKRPPCERYQDVHALPPVRQENATGSLDVAMAESVHRETTRPEASRKSTVVTTWIAPEPPHASGCTLPLTVHPAGPHALNRGFPPVGSKMTLGL